MYQYRCIDTISTLKNNFFDLTKRPFVRNVIIVATGTAASQAITVAFSPVITRLYGPDTFGVQGIFTSVVGLLATVAALGYPTAIVLPKSDSDAEGIVKLSIYTAIVFSLLTAVLFYFYGNGLLRLLNAEVLSPFSYLVPIAVFVSVIGVVLSQWLIRKKEYKLSAKYAVFASILLNVVKSGGGFFSPSAIVLISANITGGLAGTILTYFGWRKVAVEQPHTPHNAQSKATLAELAIRHRDFPLLRTPQSLINALSQSLPILLLASYFGAASAGHYSIALSVLGVPATLIGGAVMSVFYPRINDAIQKGENARHLIVKVTLGMVLTGALPFLLIMISGPGLFAFVFGEQWRKAGIYAQILSLWFFLQYVNKPSVSAIPALYLQGGLLFYELFSTGTKVIALWIGFHYFKSDLIAIALFSGSGVIAYAWLIYWVIRNSNKFYHEKVLSHGRAC